MPSLKAYQLLINASKQSEERELGASPEEVKRRVDEIKYLISQKTIPRLSLRKEILELEQELKGIITVDQELKQKKERGTLKIASLKSQMDQLKKQLEAAKNKDLNKKVEKLSYLIGESLAYHETKQDISLNQSPEEAMPEDKAKVLNELQQRLSSLKLSISLSSYDNEKKADKVKEKVTILEGKIQALQNKMGIPSESRQSKHTLLFNLKPDDKILRFEKELPLPPPPRRPQLFAKKKEAPVVKEKSSPPKQEPTSKRSSTIKETIDQSDKISKEIKDLLQEYSA